MEQEFKWKLPSPEAGDRLAADPELAARTVETGEVTMDAVYYDTADGALGAARIGLRLRREGERSVVCLKRDRRMQGGVQEREEYEAPGSSVREALPGLREAGLPPEMCALLADAALQEVCRITFRRRTRTLEAEQDGAQCRMELALDTGEGRRPGCTCPICEAELEHKAGSEAVFRAFGAALASRFGLEPQPRSKLLQTLEA